ncbi:MAG: hypothetical protein ACREN5_03395 [Gemmatimonadales bacterium]
MPVLKERTVTLNGQTVTILTPSQRAAEVASIQANLKMADRAMCRGTLDGFEDSGKWIGDAAEGVRRLTQDFQALREHRRLSRA